MILIYTLKLCLKKNVLRRYTCIKVLYNLVRSLLFEVYVLTQWNIE